MAKKLGGIGQSAARAVVDRGAQRPAQICPCRCEIATGSAGGYRVISAVRRAGQMSAWGFRGERINRRASLPRRVRRPCQTIRGVAAESR